MNNHIAMKKAEQLGLFACFLQLTFFFFTFLLSFWYSLSVYVQSIFFLMGIAIWLLCYLSLRQERLASEEELAEQEYLKEKHTIFDESEIFDPLSARNRLKIFKMWIVPIATLLFGIGFIGFAIFLFFKISNFERKEIMNAPLSAAFLCGFAFFSLLIAKYAMGMSRQQGLRVLRAGGSYLFANAAMSFFCAISVALSHTGFAKVDVYVSYLILIFMVFIGIEMLFNLLLDFYRPRVSGQEIRAAFDSRFLEISTGSKGFLKTVSQMLDYQFGFKVSETWFYQFMEKAIAPLLLFQIFSLYILNCVIVVAPHEQVIVERFGILNRVYSPGIHLKWPWPVESAINVSVQKAHHRVIGEFGGGTEDYNNDQPAKAKEDSHGHGHGHSHGHSHGNEEQTSETEGHRHNTIFTKSHHSGGEDYFLIANHSYENETENVPVNLMVVRASLTYTIKDLKAYAYNHSNPEILIDSLANKTMTRYFASTNLDSIMGKNRLQTAENLKEMIQKECDDKKLGVTIYFIGITEVHPPHPVAKDFENVISAMEQKEANILAAETYERRINQEIQAEVEEIILNAGIKKLEKSSLTTAEAHMFNNILKTYKQEKNVFLMREYLRVLEENLQGRRLIISNVKNTKQIDSLNLEDSSDSLTDYRFTNDSNQNEN